MRTVYGTKEQARREREKYRAELEAQLNNESTEITVGGYAREFHERRKTLGELSPLTYERDNDQIKRMEKYLGNMPLEELNVQDVNKTYAKLRADGASASELQKFHQKLKQVLKQAVAEGSIAQNPCDLITDIKKPEPKERRGLSLEQAVQLAIDLKMSERNGKIVAVWLALATGCRRGEALGLLWKNVDLERKRILYVEQLDKKKNHRKQKSKASKRNLAIDDGTVEFLKEWNAMQSKLFYNGRSVPPDSPVCTNQSGDFLSVSGFDKWRRQFFVEHGLGEYTKIEITYDQRGDKRYHRTGYHGFVLHELRHTQATLLIGSDADIKTVQHRLGHSSASLTMNIYAHALEENDRNAAETVGGLLEL